MIKNWSGREYHVGYDDARDLEFLSFHILIDGEKKAKMGYKLSKRDN